MRHFLMCALFLLVAQAAHAFDTTPPATCQDLYVDGMGPHTAVVAFTTSGDDGMSGYAAAYQVRYSTAPIDDSNWNSATIGCYREMVQGGYLMCCAISGLSPNTTYYFAIKFWDEVDNESGVSNSPHQTTPSTGPEADC